jgi:hypothetical protein
VLDPAPTHQPIVHEAAHALAHVHIIVRCIR